MSRAGKKRGRGRSLLHPLRPAPIGHLSGQPLEGSLSRKFSQPGDYWLQLDPTSTQRASATASVIELKTTLSEPPRKSNAVIPATDTRAAISPYSIAVAPERSSIRRHKDRRGQTATQQLYIIERLTTSNSQSSEKPMTAFSGHGRLHHNFVNGLLGGGRHEAFATSTMGLSDPVGSSYRPRVYSGEPRARLY